MNVKKVWGITYLPYLNLPEIYRKWLIRIHDLLVNELGEVFLPIVEHLIIASPNSANKETKKSEDQKILKAANTCCVDGTHF